MRSRFSFPSLARLGLLLSFAPALAAGSPGADKELAQFAEKPTAPALKELKAACDSKQLSGDAIEGAIKRMKHHPTVLRIRALAYLRMHCTDAALSEELDGLLGVEYAMKNAGPLIQALTLEEPSRSLLLELGRTEGSSGQSPFVDCDRSCLPKVEKFFNQKIHALKYLKYNEQETEIQKAMVQGCLDALEDWRKRNPAE